MFPQQYFPLGGVFALENKTNVKSSTGYPMVDLTIKLESPQVHSTDHLPNHSMEFRDMFQCTRKSINLLAIGTSSVSLQQLLIFNNSKSGLFHHYAGSTLVFILKAEKMK